MILVISRIARNPWNTRLLSRPESDLFRAACGIGEDAPKDGNEHGFPWGEERR